MIPKILPLKALRYSSEKISSMTDVVTPPYDVISPEMQAMFYDKSPYNFVRVDLAREPGELRYEAARKTFESWIQEGVLVQDEKPALYFHHHTFKLPDGRDVVRKGFFAVRRIEDFSEGGVKPHEKTLDGPKADRLKLTRATACNLSPVFSLYSDAEKKIDQLIIKLKEQAPLYDFVSLDGERHQLWRETGEDVIKVVADTLQSKPVFIADGHHRYETGLNYRNEQRQQTPPADGLEPFNYGLMYFSNMDDEGLVILPIHRALHSLKNFQLDELVSHLSQFFKVTPISESKPEALVELLAQEGQKGHAFLMLTKDSQKSFLLTMSRQDWQQSSVAASVPKALMGLDVTVLHRLIFEEILKITPQAQADQANIIYWKDTKKAINESWKGDCQVTFLLNATRIDDMRTAALAGEKMPQKSTYFFPKIVSGLVLYPLK